MSRSPRSPLRNRPQHRRFRSVRRGHSLPSLFGQGLSVGEIGALVAFCSFTFAVGAATLGGVLLLFRPDLVERYDAAPLWLGRAGGLTLIAVLSLYFMGSLLRFRALRVGKYQFVYPRPRVAARQLLAGPLELIGAAGIIFFALPGTANPGFLVVLGVFVASFSLALSSHAPSGLGVLEFAFLEATSDAPQANVIAALLVFRLLYLILPLVFAVGVVLAFERHRWRALKPLRGDRSHAIGDHD